MFAPKASPRPKGLPIQMGPVEFQLLLANTARFGIILIACVVGIAALMIGRPLLLPVALAVIVGLMFGPVADSLERRGVSPGVSAAIVVLILIFLILGSILSFAVPLSEWVARAPLIWEKTRASLMDLKEPFEALSGLQDQLKTVLGGETAMEVTVAEGNPVTDIALLAPAILGEILVFLVSLYFYLATRQSIQMSILSLCVTRRLRWRTAHVFRDVENKVSRFLLSVTFLNVCVGVVMTIATWWLGLPSPVLWGALAFILNYIPYVGQAILIAILLAVGLGTQVGWVAILAPVGVYLVVNFIEGQVIFPHFVGRSVELNPFLIFLSIIFWIWAWGPFGALVAVPALLIVESFLSHVLPSPVLAPRRPVRKTGNMTNRDVVLANAAKAIKEQAEDVAEAEAKAAEAKAPVVVEPPPTPKPRRRAIKAKPAAA